MMPDPHTHAPNDRLLQPRLYRAPTTTEEAPEPTGELLRHRKRPEWGAAICAWIRRERQAYQFEDGKLRIFPKTHVHLLEPVECEPEETMRKVRALRAACGLNMARRKLDRGDEVQLSFDQQLVLFKHIYPEGFIGEAWKKEHRGVDAPRKLKRHRDHVADLAAKKLAEEELKSLIEAQRYETAVERLIEVADATDLVTKRHVKPLQSMPWAEAQHVAEALYELLYGEQSLRHRLDRFAAAVLRATGKTPTWPMITAPLALRFPAKYVCVRPSTFREQAKTAGDGLRLDRRFNAQHYQRVMAMAQDVADRLSAAGYAPTDMLDIHDFIWVTLRPAARDKLEEITDGSVSATQVTKETTTNEDDTAVDAA
jgi:hypothetical protein